MLYAIMNRVGSATVPTLQPAATVGCPSVISLLLSDLCTSHEYHINIHHIRTGGTGDDQVVQGLEEVIGVIAPEIVQGIKALGASPVTIAGSELAPAMMAGTIDAVLTSLGYGYSIGLAKVSKTFTLTPLSPTWSAVTVMNLKTFNSLPPDLQKVVLDVGRELQQMVSLSTTAEYMMSLDTVDLSGVEDVEVDGNGGADDITVNNVGATTDIEEVEIDGASAASLTVEGTAGDDRIDVTPTSATTRSPGLKRTQPAPQDSTTPATSRPRISESSTPGVPFVSSCASRCSVKGIDSTLGMIFSCTAWARCRSSCTRTA